MITPATALQVDQVTVEHLNKHFISFVKNDNLGQISNWLIAQADLKGADCSECEELAHLHSMAVDFPKTGVPAELPPEQRKRLVSMFGSVRVYAVNSARHRLRQILS